MRRVGQAVHIDFLVGVDFQAGIRQIPVIEAWTIFDAAETSQVLDGVIDGLDVNYLGKLAAHGYRPDEPQALGGKAAPALSRAQRGPRDARLPLPPNRNIP